MGHLAAVDLDVVGGQFPEHRVGVRPEVGGLEALVDGEERPSLGLEVGGLGDGG